MNIFGQIEKLINEHGSASILKERLGLAEQQYSILEQKNSALDAENQSLKTQLQQTEKEIQRLNNVVEGFSENQSSCQLNGITSSILEFFFDAPQNISREEVSAHIKKEIGIISYHFDILQESGFIQQATIGRGSPRGHSARLGSSQPISATFRITPSGRKHVVEVIRT